MLVVSGYSHYVGIVKLGALTAGNAPWGATSKKGPGLL
jgi:hypothetical protein